MFCQAETKLSKKSGQQELTTALSRDILDIDRPVTGDRLPWDRRE
jgi:hypothetical protein